jgi:hypothetical protein
MRVEHLQEMRQAHLRRTAYHLGYLCEAYQWYARVLWQTEGGEFQVVERYRSQVSDSLGGLQAGMTKAAGQLPVLRDQIRPIKNWIEETYAGLKQQWESKHRLRAIEQRESHGRLSRSEELVGFPISPDEARQFDKAVGELLVTLPDDLARWCSLGRLTGRVAYIWDRPAEWHEACQLLTDQWQQVAAGEAAPPFLDLSAATYHQAWDPPLYSPPFLSWVLERVSRFRDEIIDYCAPQVPTSAAGDEASTNVEVIQKAIAKRPSTKAILPEVMAMLTEGRAKNVKEAAKLAGACRTRLYEYPEFKTFLKELKSKKQNIPRGYPRLDDEGSYRLEAYQPRDDDEDDDGGA